MKKLLLLVLVLGITAAASPYYLGTKVDSNLEQLVAKLSSMPGYQAELIEYNNAYTTGTGKIRLGLDLFGASGLDDMPADLRDSLGAFSTTVSLATNNGPFSEGGPFTAYTKITLDALEQLPAEIMEQIEKAFGGKEFYSASMVTGILGDTEIQIAVPSANVDDGSTSFEFAGFDTRVNLSNNFNRWVMDMNVGAFNGGDETMQIDFAGMNIDSDTDISEGVAIALGDFRLAAPKFSMTETNGEKVVAEGLLMTGFIESNSTDNSLLDASYSLMLDSLAVSEGDVRLEDFDFSISLKQVKKSSIQTLYDQIYSGNPSMENLTKALGEALNNSPKIVLDNWSFSLQNASMAMSGSVGINSNVLGNGNIVQNPLLLLPALEVTFDMSADEEMMVALAEQQMGATPDLTQEQREQMLSQQKAMLEQQLEGVIQQGFIKREGGKLVSSLEFRNGALTVNGQPMQIPFM